MKAPEPPAHTLGFALYVLGAGCAISGLAQAEIAAAYHGLGHGHSPLVHWGYPVGALMTSAGLVVAWRTARATERRLFGIAAVLWMAVFGLSIPHVARSAGWAVSLGVVAFVMHRLARTRAVAIRTWPTTLGAALLALDAMVQALSLLLPRSHPAGFVQASLSSALLVPGALGFLVLAAGAVAAGAAILAPARAA